MAAADYYYLSYGLGLAAPVWTSDGDLRITDPRFGFCGQFLRKVPLPSSVSPPVPAESTVPKVKEWFYLRHVASALALGPTFGAGAAGNHGGYNASTLFQVTPLAKDPAKDGALLFGTVDFPPTDGLDTDVVVMYLDSRDTATKGLCQVQNTAARVYVAPTVCGQHVTPWYCPYSWQTCNVATGFCQDAALVSQGNANAIAKGTKPPEVSRTPPFANCGGAAVFALRKVSGGRAKVDRCQPMPAEPDPAREKKAAAQARAADKRKLLHIGELAGLGFALLLAAAIYIYMTVDTLRARVQLKEIASL